MSGDWLGDPLLARRFARMHWLVLVGAFVLLTRFQLGVDLHRAVLGLVGAALVVLNAPVVVGLRRSRSEAHTRAFRMVALGLGLRVMAAVWVFWLLGR